ncbi:hypothetical protein LTS18_005352 [Coniosporium uncinatum]|uniref:Uncharacterized protein n=1 Tax=Coniosporium uncinatum TaxID=93489 RepID=A0ACC3DYF6_9PEZI|nr:hypothetical protein LTS18_005352 [Coniosporium uncinatum]
MALRTFRDLAAATVCLLQCSLVTAQSNSAAPSAQNATAFALLYGYPLLSFQQLAPAAIAQAGGTNHLFHSRELQTPEDRRVVKPNVDTLYSTMIFDLSQNDVNITIPSIPEEQYHLFSYYDPYGDNFANTGSGNLNAAGSYLLRRTPESATYGVVANNATGAGGGSSTYQAYVNSPTDYGILLIRWAVYNLSNHESIHVYQDRTQVSAADRVSGRQATPLAQIEQRNFTGSVPERILNLLSAFSSANPPELASEEEPVNADLTEAGISNGTYTPSSGVDLETVDAAALGTIRSAVNSSTLTNLGNGWSMISPNSTGDFGTNYGLRAAVAASGYLMLKAPNALYPSWNNATDGAPVGGTQYSLGAQESFLYTFSGKPDLQDIGFWSLTAYADNYLIPNNLNVYALGDRSNLNYPDGSSVYGSDNDDLFQILVQPADITPPANWTNNWLPAPAGGGNISLLLRWYAAEEGLTNGSYVYPVVTRQSAISNGSTPSPEQYTGGAVAMRALPPAWLLLALTIGFTSAL